MYLNARSVKTVSRTKNKLHQLHDIINLSNRDIVAITVTWLNDKVNDRELLPSSSYTVFRRDRQDVRGDVTGGGVAVLIKKNIPSLRRTDLEPNEEVLVCELKPDECKKILLVIVYRPPSGNVEQFVNNITPLFRYAVRHFHSLCIVGDFNMPDINWSTCSSNVRNNNLFCDLINECSFLQCNKIPSNSHGNILDLTLTKSREFISDPEELSVDFATDHTVIGFSLHTSTNSKNTIHRTVYNFKNVDFNLLRTVIANSNLTSSVVNSSDINISWDEWNSNLKHIIDTCIPKTIVKDTATPPWIDSEIRHVQRCKETTWRHAKTSNTESSWKKFRECRNKLSDLIKKKRKDFMSDMKQSLFLNSKHFWSFYRLKQKPKQLPVKLEGSGSTAEGSASEANLYNTFFNSVFSPKMDENADLPTISEILDTRLSTLSFTVEDVIHVLVNLNLNASVSHDSIPLRVLS